MTRTLLAALLLPAIAAGQEAPRKPTTAEIVKLIEQLDSKQFREREQATRKLAELDEVPPELEKAAKAASPETARRAGLVMEQIRWRNLEKRLARDLARINRTGVDLFLNRMALDSDYATAERWKTAAELAEMLAAKANKLGYAGFVVPRPNWAELPLIKDVAPARTRSSRVLLDGQNTRTQLYDCLIVSSGSMGRLSTLTNSILFVDGDVMGVSTVRNCLLVCTGDIGSINIMENSIVIAGGKLSSNPSARNCFFQVGGHGGHGRFAENNLYVNLKQVEGAEADKNKFVTTNDGPAEMLKWFDPATLGAKLKHAAAVVQVTGLTDGGPFDRAGLKEGDVITSIGGQSWGDVDQFARELKRALASSPAVSLTVRRGDKSIEAPLRLTDEQGK